jgi:hypothetical protein
MRILDVEEMESCFNIDLKNVSWWMSIKEACKFRAPVIVRLSKERCISLVARGKPPWATRKHD